MSAVCRSLPLLAVVALVLGLAAPAGAGMLPEGGGSLRLADTDNVQSAAVALSGATFGDGEAAHVVIGRDDVYADSLAGAALAGTAGPILYGASGPGGRLSPETMAEVARVLGAPGRCEAPRVWLLGGEAALSAELADQLTAAGYCAQRLAGATRVETSVAVAGAVRPQGSGRVLIVSGVGWADAATVGAYAAREGVPVLVTAPERLDAAVAAYLSAAAPRDIVLLGGSQALGPDVESAAARYAPVRRAAGAARDATAVAIIDELFGAAATRGVTLVDGYGATAWAYALAAAPAGARRAAPLLYVDGAGLAPATREWLARHDYGSVTAVGSRAAVPDVAVQDAVGPAAPPVPGASPVTVPQTSGWPDATNTGVPRGTVLKPSAGFTITRDGTVINGLDVSGTIHVKANNVTIRNTRVRTAAPYLIRVHAGYRGTLVEDVRLDGKGSTRTDGVSGSFMTLRRAHISGVVDGVKIGTHTLYEGNYIHSLSRASGRLHPDGMQAQGATNIVIRGNTIDVPAGTGANAGILLKGDTGAIADVLVEGNHLNGGNVTLNVEGSGPGSNARFPAQRIAVRNNVFGGDHRYREVQTTNVTGMTWTANTSKTGASI